MPVYQAKAELFRTLGQPVRIRVLELLQDGPMPVPELLTDISSVLADRGGLLTLLQAGGLDR
ncbi:hypothetical protein AB0M46_31390 [Dactylosporangium sp. NPDC051485]|uniref:hypothetical protein n=1 Tax=Dactylosporangium sp. NPDC051485 TaxID=3154846 RepID=UPI003412110F